MELSEEIGLNAAIEKEGKIFEVKDNNKVNLCHENQKFEWIMPEDIGKYNCVPGLKKDLKVLGLLR